MARDRKRQEKEAARLKQMLAAEQQVTASQASSTGPADPAAAEP
jgi:hypothetical protein|eukprot:COSAG02_NODE_5903_length_3947_cov_3.181133_3_plen_44_part_00